MIEIDKLGYAIALYKKAQECKESVKEYLEAEDYIQLFNEVPAYWYDNEFDFVIYGDKQEAEEDGGKAIRLKTWLKQEDILKYALNDSLGKIVTMIERF